MRRVTPAGVVSTLAGNGTCGSRDGAATDAQFCTPRGIALDRQGNLWVADSGNHAVRRIAPSGAVSTVAGSPGLCGSRDGRGGQARFCDPQDVEVDAWGNVYVVDTGNATIRRIDLDNVTSTVAGTTGRNAVALGALPGSLDRPIGITLTPDTALALTTHNLVIKLLPAR